jgi:hypothetical protein
MEPRVPLDSGFTVTIKTAKPFDLPLKIQTKSMETKMISQAVLVIY